MKSKIHFAILMIGMLLIGSAVSRQAKAATANGYIYEQTNAQASSTADTTKRSKVKKTARGAEKGVESTGDGVAKGSEDAAKGAADVTGDAGKATAKGARKTGKATAKMVKKVGDVFKK